MTTTRADLLNTFAQYETIIIHRHQNPDPDAFGSQMGLARALRAAYPEKHIYTVGEPAATLAWIETPDIVPDLAYNGALVVVIDTANLARIADDRYSRGAKLIKIDHHPDREPFGDLSFVDTTASSSSEIVADLIAASDTLALSPTVAAALYAGIIGDTGRFLYDLTNPHTHEVAADLMRTGIDAPAIGRQEEEFSPAVGQLLGYAISHVKVTANGAGSLILTQTALAPFGLKPGEAQAAVSFIGQLNTIRAWVLFTERPDGQYRVELRGKDRPINAIAVAHGGGGHPLASGAVANDLAEVTQITQELDQLLQK